MLDVHHDGDGGPVDVSIQDSDIQTFLKENRLNKTVLPFNSTNVKARHVV